MTRTIESIVEREWALRQEMVQVCQRMYGRGLIAATDGNVSVRLSDDLLLTTPSGLSKGLVTPDDLVVTDMSGAVIAGPLEAAGRLTGNAYRPSAEIRMHLEVYRQRPDVQAVVHAHPPITTALTVAGVSLAPCVLPETLVTMGTIVTTAYATPTTADVPLVVREPIRTHDALVLDRHGAVTAGATLLEAYARMEKVENTAQVLATARQMGAVKILPLDEVRRLAAMRREHLGPAGAERALPDCAACGACEGLRA